MARAPSPVRRSLDAPLRMPNSGRPMAGVHLEAQRQLRISLWLVAILSLATAAALLSRPSPVQVSSLPPIAAVR